MTSNGSNWFKGTHGAGATNGTNATNATNATNGANGANGVYSAGGEVPADVVRVLRGAPDEDELAALVAGIVATQNGAPAEVDDGSRTSLWNNHGHRLGLPPSAARAAWRWSAHAPH